MIIIVLIYIFIPVIELLTLELTKKHKIVFKIHLCFISIVSMIMLFKILKTEENCIMDMNFIFVLICLIIGVAIYVFDLAIKNIIQNDVLILDPSYYFTQNNERYLSIFISVVIACTEEMTFRAPLCIYNQQRVLLLVIGSVSFGCLHLFFSKYDAASKIVLGIVLGLICVIMNNFVYSIIVHIIYNILIGIFGGVTYNNSTENRNQMKVMEVVMSLVVKNLTKSYQKPVLQNIDLVIDEPGVYLIAGPNGSGKTTLLETIVGLRKPDCGEISINGFPCGSIHAKKEIGFLCQQNGLRKTIKMKEEMQLIKEIFDVHVNDMEYLKKYNLQEYYNNKTRTLSGGTQRRFLTAMLFLAGQNIVILDEPASGLDTYSRDEIWNTISEYGKEHIVIVSDHYLNQARLYSDRIILLDRGKIIANDNFEGIMKCCQCEKLIKVRNEHYKHVQSVIDKIGADCEVKVSGTVYNIYLKNKTKQVLSALSNQKITSHDLDLEDIYFYMTGKQSHTEEDQ